MWFFYAMITVLLWGAADLFYKLGASPVDRYSPLRIVSAVGIVMGAHALFQIFVQGIAFDYANIVRYLPVSLCYIASMTLGYVGLRYIELSISSPVCNSSGAISCLLCVIFLRETATPLQFSAVGVLCVGMVLLAIFENRQGARERARLGETADKKYTVSAFAIIFPILYCIIDGLGTFADAFYLDKVMSESDANIAYELTFLVAAIVCVGWLIAKKQKLLVNKSLPAFAAAAFETGGQFVYVRAMSRNAVLAAPLVSCFSIVAVLLSRIFLKEKLQAKQYIVIAVMFAAMAILGME